MTGPVRIQQRRTAGWRKPPGVVAVGRGTRWGNPWAMVPADRVDGRPTFVVRNHVTGQDLDRYFEEQARWWVIAQYWDHLRTHPGLVEALRSELAGKDVMCWCPPQVACHGDVILQVANSTGPLPTAT